MGRKKSNAREFKIPKEIKVKPDVEYVISTKKRKFKNDIRPGIIVATCDRVERRM
jgi:hypothetical protein